MRKMTHAIFEEIWASNDGQALNNNPASHDGQLSNIVIQHRGQFKRLGDLLDRQPEILSAVHRDLQTTLESQSQRKSQDKKDKRNREADFTTENLFRTIPVMQSAECKAQNAECRVQSAECKVQSIPLLTPSH